MRIVGGVGRFLTLKDTGEGQEAVDVGRWEVVGAAGNGRGAGSLERGGQEIHVFLLIGSNFYTPPISFQTNVQMIKARQEPMQLQHHRQPSARFQ